MERNREIQRGEKTRRASQDRSTVNRMRDKL
jgi:hypothetical protein